MAAEIPMVQQPRIGTSRLLIRPNVATVRSPWSP
jgi:hypothetical protein